MTSVLDQLRSISRRARRRFKERLFEIHCPHHGSFCHGRTCCCRDRHWRGVENEDRELGKRERWVLPMNNPSINPALEPVLTYRGWVLYDDFGGWIPYTGEGAA